MSNRPDIQTRVARAESFDADTGTMRCVLATEAPVRMLDWERYEEVDEVLLTSGAKPFPERVPMQDSHKRESCHDNFGHMRGFKETGSDIETEMVWDMDDPGAAKIANKYEKRHLTDVSVGYRVLEAVYVERGESIEIEGRTFRAGGARPLKIATKWSIREGSPTPIGADVNAKVRAAWIAARKEHGRMDHDEMPPEEAEEEAKADGEMPFEDEDAEEKADGAGPPADESEDDEEKPMGEKASADNIIERAKLAEKARQKEIRDLGAGLDSKIVERAIDEDMTPEQASKLFLRALRETASAPISTAPQVMTRASQSQEQKRAAVAAGLRSQLGMLERNGKVWVPPTQRGLNAQKAAERAAEEGQRYRSLSAADYLALEYETATGKRAPRSTRGLLDAVRAANSSFDLGNVFTTTFEASLVQSFEEAPDSTQGWVRHVEVPNFNTNERPRMGQLDSLERLSAGNTAKHATASDIVESYKAYRFAKQASFDEIDIINDRLSALSEIPRRLGVAAARVPQDMAYYILANGETAGLTAGAIFSSGNDNLGTSGTLASATLRAGIEAMMKQREDGVILNIQPAFFIGPVALLHTIKELLESSELLYGADDESVRGSKNVLQGVLQYRVDARLDYGVTDPITGSASTADTAAWYLAADPSRQPTIEIGHVRDTGMVPVVRSYTHDKGQWGVGWDVKFDVGAKALAFQGLYKAND